MGKDNNKKKRNMNPNSLKNLEKGNFANKTPEERKEIATNGAMATNKIIKEKKHISELAKRMVEEIIRGVDGEEKTIKEAMLRAQIEKSLSGDLSSFTMILKLIDEMPAEKLETLNTNTNIDITDDKIINKVMDRLKEL